MHCQRRKVIWCARECFLCKTLWHHHASWKKLHKHVLTRQNQVYFYHAIEWHESSHIDSLILAFDLQSVYFRKHNQEADRATYDDSWAHGAGPKQSSVLCWVQPGIIWHLHALSLRFYLESYEKKSLYSWMQNGCNGSRQQQFNCSGREFDNIYSWLWLEIAQIIVRHYTRLIILSDWSLWLLWLWHETHCRQLLELMSHKPWSNHVRWASLPSYKLRG